jgi:fumarate hydratase subunit alpha
MMRSIPAKEVQDRVRDMIIESNTLLAPDVLQAFEDALMQEELSSAREVLSQLLENAKLAKETGLALCQDTGTAIFFVEMGEDCRIEDSSLREVINKGMIEGYEKGCLRKSMCHPLTRKNTGDNSPAVIHFDLVSGSDLKISYMAKGGGSENMSRCTMLTPAQGWSGIKEFVLQRIAEAGPNPCPPTIVGLGIGGSFELAPVLAKKALLRPLDQKHPDSDVAEMENELLEEINKLGIGPMGLGGKTTSLGVRINMAPCHIASLPLAVNIQCHSSRHQEVVL